VGGALREKQFSVALHTAKRLQFRRHTYELAPAQSKPPRMMRGARDTDPRIGHHIENCVCRAEEAMPWIGT